MATPEERAKAAYEALSNFANGDKMYEYLFAECMVHDHKLLQAYVMKVIMACIETMAKQDDDRVTLQNKEAVALCRRIIELTGERPRVM